MPLDVGSHSLALLLAVQNAIAEFQSLEPHYEDAVEYNEKEATPVFASSNGFVPYAITYTPVNKSLPFYFEIKALRDLGEGDIEHVAVWKPGNKLSVKQVNTSGKLSLMIDKFKLWAELIREYNTVNISRNDRSTAEAAQEFYDSFELVDDDSTTTPFEEEKQIYLYRLLEYIKNKVEQDDNAESETAQKLLQDIALLEMRIPTATKATAVKGLSQIYAKLKVFSFRIFMDSVDVLKKEVIKGVLYGGMHKVEQAIHYIQQLAHNQ